MPILGGFRSLYFNKNKIISYLKSLEYYYKDYRIKNNTKKKKGLLSTLKLVRSRILKYY